MAQPANVVSKFNIKGDREDLIDKIYNTSPKLVPVSTAIGRVKATNTYHEWQRDILGAANKDNAAIDGDDFTADVRTPTERVGNYCQILTKRPAVTRRANVVNKAGRATQMAMEKAKSILEMKRDWEATILSNNAAVAGTNTTASKAGGLGVQIYGNTSHGAGGSTAAWSSGAPTSAPTAGTARALTVAMFNDVLQKAYIASGEVPEKAFMSPKHKEVFSGFAGIAANRSDVKDKQQATITVGADMYVSNFGVVEIIPHHLMAGATDIFLLNTEYIDSAFLTAFEESAIGKTGDSEKVLLTSDVTLRVGASSAQGKISDLSGG